MYVRRFYDDRLAQASYLIGCQRTGEAIVIDPPRDSREIVDAARREGLRITRVTETHIHADFLSGTRELAAATGAQPLLSAEGGTDWQYGWGREEHAQLLHDGDRIVMGGVELAVRHTPGHTPEHIVFIVTDMARSPEPLAMVSGDFLFVGDVGRPDLLERAAGVAGSMEDGARRLFRSLAALRDLPDHLQIWPGHGAGSACGKALGAVPSSTLGYERRTNWAFGVSDEQTFVTAVLEGQPAPPVYFATMKRLNRDGPAVLGTQAPLPRQEPAGYVAALRDGILLDVRPAARTREGHVRGALTIPLIKAFTTWAGWLIPYDRTIRLLASNAEEAEAGRRALASIGLDRVAGWFDDSALEAARADGAILVSQLLDIDEAPALMAAGRTVIDLRNLDEWNAGHIPGAMHHPLGTLPRTVAAMDRDTPIAVHCQGGTRSAIGASVLEQMGFTNVVDLPKGYGGWKKESRE